MIWVLNISGEALKINKTINELYLRGNQISKNGAKYIYDGLENNSTITCIYFDYYPIINQICNRNRHNIYQKNITLMDIANN